MSFSGLCGYFSYFWYKVSGKTIKTAFQVSRGTWFMKKNEKMLSRKLDLFQLRTLSKFLYEVFRNLFGKSLKLAFYVTTKTFWRDNFSLFLKTFFFLFFGFWPRSFRAFRPKQKQKWIQCIQANEVMKNNSFIKLEMFYDFRILNEKSFDFLLENFGTVVRSVLAFRGKKFFFNIWQRFLVFFVLWTVFFHFWLTLM